MKPKGRVFLVDDDELIVSMLARALKAGGYDVQAVTDPAGVVDKIRAFAPDAVLLDVNLPGKSGMDLLGEILEGGHARQVIMLTADDSAETAVRAMKLGAADYLTKPFNLEEVKLVVDGVVERGALRTEVDYLRKITSEVTDRPFVGVSESMRDLKEQAQRLAEAGVHTILITGESGVGKEVLARHIHALIHGGASFGYAPFIGINCAALPEPLVESELFGHEKGAFTDARAEKKGVFEMARGGSILLDEIGEMAPHLQTKLLRVLEERQVRRVGGRQDIPFDAVVFATTNRRLEELVLKEKFRGDLFYRLNAFALHIPPLRERREDIPALARFFLERLCARYRRAQASISPEAERLMMAYDWPGNAREVRNVVERIVVLQEGTTVLPEHMPKEILRQQAPRPASTGRYVLPDGGLSLDELEKDLIAQALAKAEGNKTLAAKLLNISYDSLRYQIKKFDLE